MAAEKRFEIGEKLVYGAVGVVEVVDVRVESIGDVAREYYVLRDVSAGSDSHTFVPVDNERLVGSMRRILTKDEAERLISEISDLPTIEWNKDSRSRIEKFREITESGDHRSIISMIKSIRKAGEARQAEGKKNFLTDENAMRKAERLLHSELALALGIPAQDVPDYIDSHIK